MKRLFTLSLILLILASAMAETENLSSFEQYMQKAGFVMYSIDSLETLVLPEDTFDGKYAYCSLLGCVYGKDQVAFFGRLKNGELFIAKNPYESILDAFSPTLGDLSMIGLLVEGCKTYNFSIGVFIDSNGAHFGLSEDTEVLNSLADKLWRGSPNTRVIGWDNFARLILLH